MTHRIVPIGKSIVLLQKAKEKKSELGIIFADSTDLGRPDSAEVLSVGDEVLKVKQGSIVLFKKYSPDEFDVEGTKYLLIQEQDVLALVQYDA